VSKRGEYDDPTLLEEIDCCRLGRMSAFGGKAAIEI
jgi:hypothetical protein